MRTGFGMLWKWASRSNLVAQLQFQSITRQKALQHFFPAEAGQAGGRSNETFG